MEMDKFNSLCSTNGTIAGSIRKLDYCLVMVIIDGAILIFTSVLLCLVVAASTVHSAIRFVLANILISSIVPWKCLDLSTHHPCNQLSCFLTSRSCYHGNWWKWKICIYGCFAVVVVAIIKCSSSAVKLKYLVVSVVVVWTACVAVGAVLFFPGVLDLSKCLADVVILSGIELWVFAVPYFLLFVIISCTLATVLPVYAFCYVRSNLVSENVSSLKPMLKFTLFLLFGNALCFFGNTLSTTGGFASKSAKVGEDVLLDLIRLYHVSLGLSLIPTPILIFVYFKPVRIKLKKCV